MARRSSYPRRWEILSLLGLMIFAAWPTEGTTPERLAAWGAACVWIGRAASRSGKRRAQRSPRGQDLSGLSGALISIGGAGLLGGLAMLWTKGLLFAVFIIWSAASTVMAPH